MAGAQVIPAFPVIQGVEFRHVLRQQLYCVGSDGSVWSCKNARWGARSEWRRLKPTPSDGYLVVGIGRRNGNSTLVKVHILVLEAFVGPRPAGLLGLHDDGDRRNNVLTNLYWGTYSDNVKDSIRHGTHFTPFAKGGRLTPTQIIEVRSLRSEGLSLREIGRRIGSNCNTVRDALLGIRAYASRPA